MYKKYISLSVVIIAILTVFMCPVTMATSSVTSFINISNITPDDDGIMSGKIGPLMGTLQWIGYIVAIGMLIWVGIKYVMSGASEKAKAKETLVPLVFGAVLVAAGTAITAAVFGVFAQ